MKPGGCLCGKVRFAVDSPPIRVTICHCRWCQHATGTAYMIEPIFPRAALRVTAGEPAVFTEPSRGSGKLIHAHFCRDCGTRLWLTFERFPEVLGVYAGVFDDPTWFPIGPENARVIFTSTARPDAILPAGLACFAEHVTDNAGVPQVPVTHAAPHPVGTG